MGRRYAEDITNKVFGRLTVICEVEPTIHGNKWQKRISMRRFKCQCSCGNIKIISRMCLVAGTTNSCGCINKERVSKLMTTHGCSYKKATPLQKSTYYSWKCMRDRCNNPNSPKYKYYGGKGITVCDRWMAPIIGFSNFVEDMGFKPDIKLTIDRLISDGNYEPSNCKWSTRKEQQNNKLKSRKIEYNGKFYSIKDLAKLLNMNKYTLRGRIYDHHWPIDKAINEPVKFRRKSENGYQRKTSK